MNGPDGFLDLNALLKDLAASRPIFHSEADFQHAVAWAIHERLPDSKVRLEFTPSWLDERLRLDIWLEHDGHRIAIELKYKTRRIVAQHSGEAFFLQDHAAQDLGRYDFLKDLQRLETVVASLTYTSGYAALLTNDSAYWTAQHRATVDAAFRLPDGRQISGELAWSVLAGQGTVKTREAALRIAGAYPLAWQDYSETHPQLGNYGRFRFLLIEVPENPISRPA